MKSNEISTETNNRKQNRRNALASRRPSACVTVSALALFGAACVFMTACGSSTAGTASKDAVENAALSQATQADSAALSDVTADAAGVSQGIGSTPGAAGISASGTGVLHNTVTVNSSEKVTVVPDIAQVVYAVQTEAKNAADCRTKNEEDTGKVLTLLKSLGVAGTSIQTSDYSMYPIYNYSGNTQKITGYEATATLTVSDLPIDSLGNLLTQSVQAGINHITSITYQSSSYDESYRKALQLAVAAAHEKAAALAEAAGCSLGKAVSIVENSNYSEARYTDNALASKTRTTEALMDGAADLATNIMPGEVEVEVNITVEYLLP